MFCKKCGAPLLEGAKFCGNCGEPVPAEPEEVIEEVILEETPEETPKTAAEAEETALEPAPEKPEENKGPTAPVQPAPELNTTLWIVLCAIECILCCSFIPGVFGLIFAIIAAVRKGNGEYADAASSLKIAKIAFWVGVVLIVLSAVLTVLLTALGVTSLYSLGEAFAAQPSTPEPFSYPDSDFFEEIVQEIPGITI